jgi:uncharacterized protein YndB with AHSA1/START domain
MATTQQQTDTLQLQRTFAAPPERVWEAWTSAEAMSRWFRPADDYACTVHALDVRPGGRYRLELTHAPKGVRHIVSGTYEAVEPPRRLAFTWRWEDNPTMPDTLVTIELRPLGGGTELTLTHTRLAEEKLREDHRHGWTRCLERLAGAL